MILDKKINKEYNHETKSIIYLSIYLSICINLYAQSWSQTSVSNACFISTGLIGGSSYAKDAYIRLNQELAIDFGSIETITRVEIRVNNTLKYTSTVNFVGLQIIPPLTLFNAKGEYLVEIKYWNELGDAYIIPYDLTVVDNHDAHYFKTGGERMLVWYGSGNTMLTKPFIIVEGFDPENINNENLYYHASGTPLVQQLRQLGYDVVIYQFANGGGDLTNNSAHVQSAIKYLKQRLQANQSNEKMILSGVSMGGLIARHALIQLEKEYYPHGISTFISMDSPQRGAVMPVNFMTYIKSKDPQNKNKALSSMAAKQMLRNNPYATQNEYSTFFSSFDSQNMPTTTLNVGVSFSNGQERNVNTNAKWLAILLNSSLNVIPFVDWGYQNEEKKFYVYEAPEGFVPGSLLPKNKTNTSGTVERELLHWLNQFIIPFGSIKDSFVTMTHISPTFIPYESALNINSSGVSAFDNTIQSSINSYHDQIPEDIIDELLSIIEPDYLVFTIKETQSINASQIQENTKLFINDDVTLHIVGNFSANNVDFYLNKNAKLLFSGGNVVLNKNKFIGNTGSKVDIATSNTVNISQTGNVIVSGEIEFSNSFHIRNYGVLGINEGSQLTLKNMTHYTGSEFLVSGTSSNPVEFKVQPNGNLTIQGKATIKHAHFQKASGSNFNYVSLSGSASKTLEQVSISGSQYGLLVNNVPSQALTLTNISGSNNYYSTLKATNSTITLNGFTSQDAQAQDALSAYTNSSVFLEGHFTAYNHLIGIRSAYSSLVVTDQDLDVTLSLNTRGIHAYASSSVFLTTTLHKIIVTGNTRQDPLYGVNPFDVYAVDGSSIFLFGVTDPTAITQYKDATSSI